MYSRPESRNQAASAAPQGAQYANEVNYLKNALQGANSQIGNLHDQICSDNAVWERERLNLCHKVHNGRYRVNRLQDLMDLRQSDFKDELQKSVQTISKQELEIARLTTLLKFKDDEVEAAKCYNKEQMEKKEAQLETERQINSDLRDQMFKASLENHRTASLQKDTQMRLDLAKQQVQQRDNFIQALRKEKEGLSQKLFETSAQLRRMENESFQKDPQEEKYKALQEKFTKEREEKQKICTTRIIMVEQEKSELVEENQKLFISVKELEKENKVLVKTRETLTARIDVLEMNAKKQADEEHSLITRIQEVEMENKELVNKEKTMVAIIELERETTELELRLNKKKKKRGFWSKTFKGKTEDEQQNEKEEMEREQREEEEQKKDEQKNLRRRSSWKFWKKRDEENEAKEAPCSLVDQPTVDPSFPYSSTSFVSLPSSSYHPTPAPSPALLSTHSPLH